MNQNYNTQFKKLIGEINFEGAENEKRKASEQLAQFVHSVESDRDFKNSILSHDLYEELAKLSFEFEFYGILNLPSKIVQGIFDSIPNELEKDLFIYKAICGDYFYPADVQILSDDFINYIPQIESNRFWKIYLNIFLKNPVLADEYKSERFHSIDNNFKNFNNGNKKMKMHITPSNLIERFVEDSLHNFLINYKTYLRAKQDLNVEIKEVSPQQERALEHLYRLATTKDVDANEVLGLYSKLKRENLDLNSAMYDIISASRTSFNDMISEEINLTDITSLPSKKVNGIDVYTLSPEDNATFLVHSHGVTTSQSPEDLKTFYSTLSTNHTPHLMSMSIITPNNISSIYPVGEDLIVFGFQNIERDYIAHSSIVDSFSRGVLDGNPISHKPQFLTSKENFIKYSAQYNEVNYKIPCCYDNKSFYPSFILINDGFPKNYHYEFAREFNIPIVVAPFVKEKAIFSEEIQKNQAEANINYFEP